MPPLGEWCYYVFAMTTQVRDPRQKCRSFRGAMVALAVLLFALRDGMGAQQKASISPSERNYVLAMLYDTHEGIKKHYYDPKFHGVDMDARYKEYVERIKGAATLGDAVRMVAAYLSALDDSHTYLIPPQYSLKSDYGYRIQIFGDSCFVTHLQPGTDAEEKLHPGDQVLTLGGFAVNRKDFVDLQYYLKELSPKATSTFLLRDPAGSQRQEVVKTRVATTRRHVPTSYSEWLIEVQKSQRHLRNRWVEIGDVLIWNMQAFIFTDAEIDHMMEIARKHRALILDLRGNGGGAVDTLLRLLSRLFDQEVRIGKRVTRQSEKEQAAKKSGKDNFGGQLIVLVDSESASASEILARTVQLEHRATIVGDVSAGAVRESEWFPGESGQGFDNPYAISVTVADLIMTDGKSLEKVGVIPDVLILPTAEDLARGRDPAMAKAAELAGIKLDPATAGRMFPYEWAPD